MAEDVLLVMARRNGRWIAGAINFIGSDTLFGRNWGAIEHHPFLHFEVCYYQAIDFAIQRGLKTVEAGAQGEHKIARGYLPQTTYSAHYIADPGLRRAIADYLKRERAYVAEAARELTEAGPFRKTAEDRLAGDRNSKTSGAAMTAYDSNNPFAKILRGEFPCYKVYEDDHVLAFLDIMPRCARPYAGDPEGPCPQHPRYHA